MKAMILAAGLGKRMRPLTEHTPKPLLKVAGLHLIEYHLQKLEKAGFKEVVINTHWLAEQIPEALGDGSRWGLKLHFSHEPNLLETAGGILKALPALVGDKPNTDRQANDDDSESSDVFLVINGDVYCELDLAAWLSSAPELDSHRNAYLALVENPDHHLEGDFVFTSNDQPLALIDQESAFTYSGIALFHASFFKGLPAGPSRLGVLLKHAIAAQKVFGAILPDYWLDVGTPERFECLRKRLE